MDTYTFLRELADSWVLLALFAFFVGAVIFVFRPGARKMQDDAANLPFRHEDAPPPDPVTESKRADVTSGDK